MKTFRTASPSLIVGALLLLPVTARAQEATLSGTVADSTGGVLPTLHCALAPHIV